MTFRLLPWLLAPGAAAAWWFVGFLPWVTGRLRRAGLTGGPYAPDQGLDPVRMAVPLVAEELVGLVVMALLGGVLAGALVGLCRERLAAAMPAVLVGVVAAVVLTLVQARRAVSDGATGEFATDDRVLGALQAIVATSTAAGVLLGFAAVLGPPLGRATALAVPAAVLPSWIEDLLPGDTSAASPWLLALTLGLALVSSVPSTTWQTLAWVPAGLLVWTAQSAMPALLVAAGAIRPGTGLDDHPWYPLEVAVEVFRSAFATPDAHQLRAWAGALFMASAISAVMALHRTRPEAATPDGPPSDWRRGAEP